MAFTLGLGKVVAPMAFVYSPVLLFVSSTGFDLWTFAYAGATCILGVFALSIAVVGHFLVPMGGVFRLLMGLSGLIFIAPSLQADLVALILAAPAVAIQLVLHRRARQGA